MAKYLDQAGLQLVLSKLTNKYDGRYLGLHATADAAQKTVHKLTINVRDEESRVFDGSGDISFDVAQASHRHPASEIDFTHAGMTGVANVNEALDVLIKNVQIANGVISSATANMNTLKDALDQEIADREEAVRLEKEAREAADTGLDNRLKVLEDLLDGSGNVDEAIKGVLELLNAEIERSKGKDDDHDELLENHEGRLDVIEGEGEGSIKKAVKDEQDRAVAKENELNQAIGAEKSRAEQAEQGLQDAIDDEEERALAAEGALSERITANKTAIDLLNADENTEGSVAKDIKDAEARVKVVTDALDGRMTGAEARLDVIQGEGEGSIKKAVADLVDGAPETLDTLNELAAALRDDKDVLTAIETAFDNKLAAEKQAREAKEQEHEGRMEDIEEALAQEVQDRKDAVSGEAQARQAADEALDARIDDIEALIGDEEMSLTEIREAIEANEAAIEAEKDRAEAAEKAIQDQIDIIDGDANTEGSFRKAIADQAATQLAKDNAQDARMDGIDTAIGVQGEGDAIGTGVHGRIDQEAATRKSEDDRLEGRIADIEELIGDGEGSTTLADLNERLTAVEAEQLVQNQNIAANAAAIAAIVALEETDIDAAFNAVFQ
jgi:chromosome segregation ATPase